MDWNEWTGKRIFVQLRSGGVYSGKVDEVSDMGDGVIFISITDKFGQSITFTIKEIVKIVEEGK